MGLRISDFSIPDCVEQYRNFWVSCTICAEKIVENVPAFLAFYRKKELWYVLELEGSLTLNPHEERQLRWKTSVSADLPNNRYQVVFGLHGCVGTSKTTQVSISGGELCQKRQHKPMSYGIYEPEKTGNRHFWYVNQNHALIWDGKPYIPVGGMFVPNYIWKYKKDDPEGNEQRFRQDVEMLEKTRKEGIKHIYLNTCRGMDFPTEVLERYFDKLDELGFQYGLQVGSLKRKMKYYSVSAANDMICAKTTGSGMVTAFGDLCIPNGGNAKLEEISCKYIVINEKGEAVDSGDGEAVQEEKVTKYTANIKTDSQGNYRVFFTPIVSAKGTTFHDPFIDREEIRSSYLNFAKKLRAGDGFRCFVDIITNESGLFSFLERVKLIGEHHDKHYASWLSKRYKTPRELMEKWRLAEEIDFKKAACLTPFYISEDNGSAFALDHENRIYGYDPSDSVLWDDYLLFRGELFRDYNDDTADWIKSSPNSCVPVVFKHVSVLETYNITGKTVGGFDGIGGEIYGNFETALGKETYAMSEAAQSPKTVWHIITECQTEENLAKKYDGEWGYPSERYMHDFFDLHIKCGAKGIYDFLVFTNMIERLKAYSYDQNPSSYGWNNHYREYVEANTEGIASHLFLDDRKICYFYPPTESWWMKANRRTVAMRKKDYVDTRVFHWNEKLVINTFDPFIDKDYLFVNLEDAPATVTYGKKLNDYLIKKPRSETVVYMGMRYNLGAIPEIDRYFSSEVVHLPDGPTVQRLVPDENTKVLAETDGIVWAIKKDNLVIISNSKWNQGVSAKSEQYSEIGFLDLIEK